MLSHEVHQSPSWTNKFRRVILICASFTRNLAYARAGAKTNINGNLCSLSHPQCGFWTIAHNNFIDLCILEWCKLFHDRNNKYCYVKVVGNSDLFKADLLKNLNINNDEFKSIVDEFRECRDKFVSHLDQQNIMEIPKFDLPQRAVEFYYDHIVSYEVTSGDLTGLPTDTGTLKQFYERSLEEAEAVYRHAVTFK